MPFYINPKRLSKKRTPLENLSFRIKCLICKPLLALGFKNVDYYYVHGGGNGNHLYLGNNISTADANFNITSGNIYVGDNTIFGHNVFVLTGFHRFHNGRLAKLQENSPREVPTSGFDIRIGSGCYIGTSAIILRGVTIGENVIVAAGAVVNKNVPDGVLVAGIPAKIVHAN